MAIQSKSTNLRSQVNRFGHAQAGVNRLLGSITRQKEVDAMVYAAGIVFLT